VSLEFNKVVDGLASDHGKEEMLMIMRSNESVMKSNE
jgi:hypothetical protein